LGKNSSFCENTNRQQAEHNSFAWMVEHFSPRSSVLKDHLMVSQFAGNPGTAQFPNEHLHSWILIAARSK
jgi:hypothetical protein